MGNSLKFLIQYGHLRASEWAGICFLQAKAVFASLTWQAEPWCWHLREQLPRSCPVLLSGQKTDPVGQEFGRDSAPDFPVHTDGGRQNRIGIQAAWSLLCRGNLFHFRVTDFTLSDHDKYACLKKKDSFMFCFWSLYHYIITLLATFPLSSPSEMT